MKLNKTMPQLPDWPALIREVDSYVVEGRHLTHGWFKLARWTIRLLLVIFLYKVGKDLFSVPGKPLEAFMTLALVYAMPSAIILAVLPIAQWAAWLFLRRKTKVRFTAKAVDINGKSYARRPDIVVQFLAQHPAVKPRSSSGNVPRNDLYERKFIRIEMLYGQRLVPITTVDSEEKAAQFALMLQEANRLSLMPPSAVNSRTTTQTSVSKSAAE